MAKTCDRCEHYTPAKVYEHLGGERAAQQKNQGGCALLGDSNDGTADDDKAYGWDYESYRAGVYVGPKFGCIHWLKKARTTPAATTVILIPNHGWDYLSAERVLEHLKEGRDFIVSDCSSPWDGKPCNLPDLKRAGVMHARIRYDRLRKFTLINISEIA